MYRIFSKRLIAQRSANMLCRNKSSSESGKNSTQQSCAQSIPNVEGFSKNVLDVPDYPVGFAGAKKDTDYKCPEYFCYHIDTFAESMVELENYRLPVPSSLKKNKP